MIKNLLALLLTLWFLGCSTIVSNESSSKVIKENCRSVPKVWWGRKGNSPSNNNLWKCYDWILKAR